MVDGYFIYLDLCAFALFLGMIFTVAYRKTTITASGKFFLIMMIMGALSSITNILSIRSSFGTYPIYFINVFYLISRVILSFSFCLYIIGITDNWHKFHKKFWAKLLISLPALTVIGFIIANYWNGWVFQVINGIYQRGMLMNYGLIYGCALLYFLIALIYFIIYRSFFTRGKQFAIVLIYPLLAVAVVIQILMPYLLLENIATAFAALCLMNVIERPELNYELEIGLKKYNSFVYDSYMASKTKKKTSLVFIKIVNENNLDLKLSYKELVAIRSTIGEMMKSTAKDFSLKGEYYWLGQSQYAAAFTNENHDNVESYAMTLRRRLNVPVKTNFGIVDLYSNVALVKCPDDIDSAEISLNFLEDFIHIAGVLDSVLDLAKLPNKREFEISMHMEAIIKRALMYKSFDVYFQPIYSVKDKSFTRAEALLRLHDEKFGDIEPAKFLPEAERNGAIHKIGDIVFDKVCQFIASKEFEELGLEKIEVNLSVTQCAHEDLPIHVMDAVKRYSIDPSKIDLEITESADAYSKKMTEDNIKVLKELGFSFSLDDYGQGYSNMDNVSSMPVDVIKFDKSLTKSEDPRMKVMFDHSIKMIKDLKREIVVEGVETEDMLNQFESSLCDYIQGYYFSKPLPKEDFIDFLYEKKGIKREDLDIENDSIDLVNEDMEESRKIEN